MNLMKKLKNKLRMFLNRMSPYFHKISITNMIKMPTKFGISFTSSIKPSFLKIDTTSNEKQMNFSNSNRFTKPIQHNNLLFVKWDVVLAIPFSQLKKTTLFLKKFKDSILVNMELKLSKNPKNMIPMSFKSRFVIWSKMIYQLIGKNLIQQL